MRKLRKNVILTKNINFAKLQSAKIGYFGIIVNFVVYFIPLGKKTLLKHSCQLEIDHVTQKPKETCQRTCRGHCWKKKSKYSLKFFLNSFLLT